MEPVPVAVAVTVLVDGMLAVVGTVKEPLKLPSLSAVTVATDGLELELTL